mgnify:CR=1 FL=1
MKQHCLFGIGQKTALDQDACALYALHQVYSIARSAFSLIRPHKPVRPLTEIATLPVEEWRDAGMNNDFEESVFAKYPAIGEIKDRLYDMGAVYASMSGSGSSLFGLFKEWDEIDADKLNVLFPNCYVWHSELGI